MIEYSTSLVNVLSSNPPVGPLLRIKISFFLLSACREELLSTPNVITFLPNLLLPDNKKASHASNPIPFQEQKYLSGSAFLVNLRAPNKEFNNVNLLSRSSHKFIS